MSKYIDIVNATQNESDLFPFMTDNTAAKWTAWAFSCFLTVIAPCALYSVIWYERFGSDKKRTLVNMLFAQMCWTTIAFMYSVHIIELIRYSYGPLASSLCFLQLLVRLVLVEMAGHFLCGIIIARSNSFF